MTHEDNERLVRRYFAGIARDWEPGGHPGWLFNVTDEDEARYRASHVAFRDAFPDYRMDIEELVVTDTVVAFRGTVTATHLGPWEGITATGKQVRWRELWMLHIVDGTARETHFLTDALGRLRQLEAPS